MGVWQIIMIVWLSIGLLLGAYAHGKNQDKPNNFIFSLVGTGILVLLLSLGGFWNAGR